MKLKIKTLPHYDLKNWGLPSYGSDGAAGFDLRAAFNVKKEFVEVSDPDLMPIFYGGNEREIKKLLKDSFITIQPNSTKIINSGFCVDIPDGYELQIRSRSGKGVNEGLVIAHGVGTVDSDYRGEIKIALRNISNEKKEIYYGELIAQAILAPVFRDEWEQIDNLTETNRGGKWVWKHGSIALKSIKKRLAANVNMWMMICCYQYLCRTVKPI